MSVNNPSEESQAQGFIQTIPSNPASGGPNSLPDSSNTTGRTPHSVVNVYQLEQHCKNLEDELDQVKFQIVKIVSDKNDFSKENAVLKTYQNAFAALTEQNELLKRKVRELSIMNLSSPLERAEQVTVSTEILNGSGKRSQISEIDRSSPDGQEKDTDQIVTCKSTVDTQDGFIKLKEKIAESEREKNLNKETFEMERKEYMDRNKYVCFIKSKIVFHASNSYNELESITNS